LQNANVKSLLQEPIENRTLSELKNEEKKKIETNLQVENIRSLKKNKILPNNSKSTVNDCIIPAKKRPKKLSQLTSKHYNKRLNEVKQVSTKFLNIIADKFQLDNLTIRLDVNENNKKNSPCEVLVNPSKKLMKIPQELNENEVDECTKMLVNIGRGKNCEPEHLGSLVRFLLEINGRLESNQKMTNIAELVWILDHNQISLSKYGKLKTAFPFMPSIKKLTIVRNKFEDEIKSLIPIYSGENGGVWVNPILLLEIR